MSKQTFTKMQGLGNDFVVVDAVGEPSRFQEAGPDRAVLARSICDRRFGVGADGLLLLERGSKAPFRMTVINADGSEAEMCGNGLRCAGRLLKERGLTSETEIDVETGAGVLHLAYTDDGSIRVDAGPVRFQRSKIGMVGPADEEFIECDLGQGLCGSAVMVGNPHLVVFVDDVERVDLTHIGPQLEYHPLFPNRINVHIAQVLDRHTLRQRTWERGAGLTLACGTGACAVAAAGFRTGRSDRKVEVRLPGGSLAIEYLENGNALMTGPAEVVYEGELPWSAGFSPQ